MPTKRREQPSAFLNVRFAEEELNLPEDSYKEHVAKTPGWQQPERFRAFHTVIVYKQ